MEEKRSKVLQGSRVEVGQTAIFVSRLIDNELTTNSQSRRVLLSEHGFGSFGAVPMLTLSLAMPVSPRFACASGAGVTQRRGRHGANGTTLVSSNSGQSTWSSNSRANTRTSVCLPKKHAGSLSSRLTSRGAVLTRAVDNNNDKFQLAAAIVNARQANDDCLSLLLNEMSTLSAEVKALRSEVEALKKGRGGVGAGVKVESAASTITTDTGDDDRVMRQMMEALGVDDGEKSKAPEPVPFPDEDFQSVEIKVDAANWSGDGTDRSHLWPLCKQNDDDIYLMATMQAAMNDAGFWAGEEDEADFYFGPSTVDALCYFQASTGLPETGVCCADTWRVLLGEERFMWGPAPGAMGFEEEGGDGGSATSDDNASPLTQSQQSAKTWSETQVTALTDDEDSHATGREDLWGDEKTRNKESFEKIRADEQSMSEDQKSKYKKWPVLRSEDGGYETHKLQVLLDKQGYYSGEEDMEYWYFGMTTENALGTFQASNGIPDTGLTCANTWKTLLGEAKFAMDPTDALDLVPDGEYPLDLASQKRVFLLGEGRFEQ